MNSEDIVVLADIVEDLEWRVNHGIIAGPRTLKKYLEVLRDKVAEDFDEEINYPDKDY